MSSQGYTPHIREATDGGDVNDKLHDENDPFPYVNPKDSDVTAEESFLSTDRYLCHLMYSGIYLSQQVATYYNFRNEFISNGCTPRMRLLSAKLLNKNITSAQEGINETDAVIAKIYSKISEYINTIINTLDKWFVTSADLQGRTLDTLYKASKNRIPTFDVEGVYSKLIDINNGGAPTAESLKNCLISTNNLFKAIDTSDPKNPTVSFIYKFIKFIQNIESADDSQFSNMTDGNQVFDNLPALQDILRAIGVSFDGSEAASFNDALEYRQVTIKELGYTSLSVNELIKVAPTKQTILQCLKYIDVLKLLNRQFSAAQANKVGDADVEKYKELLETIPNVLTLVISIYRSAIVATRYYTTMISDIVENVTVIRK